MTTLNSGHGDLLKHIARDHSVVVVEHDMRRRELGVKVTVLHEGAVSQRFARSGSADERVIEVTSAIADASVESIDLFYGAAQALRSVS